jgi:preprotein translocase subunit SecY
LVPRFVRSGQTSHVFTWMANVWRVPDLRRRLMFTGLILALYRLGSWIPAPGVNQAQIQSYFNGKGGSLLGLLNLFSGGSLSRFSLFALGIMPYVTASIVFQLLTPVIPRLDELKKEGDAGQAAISQYTRYLTVALAALQAAGYSYLFHQTGVLQGNAGRFVLIALALTVGTVLLMFMGEQITKRGVGNGISILIFASIISYAPAGVTAWVNGGPMEKLFFPIVAIFVIVSVVFVQGGLRKIPIRYARRQMSGQNQAGGDATTYLPLRVNMAGVIPVIFAAALLAFPPTIAQFFPSTAGFINTHMQPTNWGILIAEFVLIIVFTYFYTAVQFDPVDQAENLNKAGGYIPGIRPGPTTAMYLDTVLKRLTFPGALFLAAIAILPTLFIKYGGFSQATSRALGGTSVLIVVGVVLDTVRQMEAQMTTRNYEGFLRKR